MADLAVPAKKERRLSASPDVIRKMMQERKDRKGAEDGQHSEEQPSKEEDALSEASSRTSKLKEMMKQRMDRKHSKAEDTEGAAQEAAAKGDDKKSDAKPGEEEARKLAVEAIKEKMRARR